MGTKSNSKKKLLASAKARTTTSTRKIIPNTDGRTKAARHVRAIYRQLREANRGDWTIHKDEIAKAAAGLSVFCAQQRLLLVAGDPAYDHDATVRTTNSYLRLLRSLGHKDPSAIDGGDGIDIDDYLEGRARKRTELDDE